MNKGLFAMLLSTSVLLAASGAMAQAIRTPTKLPERMATFTRDEKGTLEASFSFRDVVDSEVRRKLHSGLTTVFVLAGGVFVMDEEGTPVVGTGIWQSCRITFDVWNEVYRLQITGSSGEQKAVAVNTEGVLRRCAQVRKLPIHGNLDLSKRYFLAATVEVNPVSQEMIEQVRRWVTRPPGSMAATPGDSLFGSFVGLFVARIGKAERTLSFRTQAFFPPP